MECLLRNIIYTLVEQLENVLILILMECLLSLLKITKPDTFGGLNPYSNGMLT